MKGNRNTHRQQHMETGTSNRGNGIFRTLVPARIDRLPWTRFQTLILVALGISWFLQGLETQLFSQGSVVLQNQSTLGLSTEQVGLLSSFFLVGEVGGALIFARLTDTLGRRKLFFITLAVYMLGNVISVFAHSFEFLLFFRIIVGMGVGGEQVAIVSAIDEMIPARHRARANIAIGATSWLGTMAAAGLGFLLYNPDLISINVGWRLALLIGPVLSIVVMLLRRDIPESPRWLMTHGRGAEAEQAVAKMEDRVRRRGVELSAVSEDKAIVLRENPDKVRYGKILRVLFVDYRKRSLAAFAMLATQGFLYNGIFFTFALVLAHFYNVAPAALSYYIFIFGAGNALGAVLGPLFDTVGRRKMALFSYVGSGLILALTGVLFYADVLSAVTITILWWAAFFIASAGAGSAYVIASEVFPIEMRSGALSVFYSISQGVGAIAPAIFAALIGDGSERLPMMYGYLFAALMVIIGGVVMWFFGVDSERKSLEDIAEPLSAGEES
ncbi:MAG TPA: MFS transporter [Bacillales bacterium]|nr:MFS transporter [Bacillales bacterium]